jgi:hypothetical protein
MVRFTGLLLESVDDGNKDPKTDVKFRPLKRVPFGPRTPDEIYRFPKPPPLPPKDFYPRKPPYWQLYGTPAYKTRNNFALAFALGAAALGGCIMWFRRDQPAVWHKRIFGDPYPSPDEIETRQLAKQARIKAWDGLIALENPHKPADERRKESRLKGHLVDHGSTQMPRGIGSRLRDIDSDND